MAATRRAQILMEPDEYVKLESLARSEKVSVAELIRRAIRRCYFLPPADRTSLVSEICSMDLPLGDWSEQDITDGHDAALR
jgi:hypothetical protein